MKENALQYQHCLFCDKLLDGHPRKKYCDQICRQKYYQALKSMVEEEAADIQTVLKRNRQILKKLLGRDKKKAVVSKFTLDKAGFHFKYITQIQDTKNGTVYCCYEFGYFSSGEDRYTIIKVTQ